MDTVDINLIDERTNSNLCEHQSWASAMLRFLIKHKNMLSEREVHEYEDKLLSFLDILTEPDITKATPRQTIMRTPHASFGAYNVFKSSRVQELFFGITILLDAYLYFGDKKYLEYAIGATDNAICNYRNEIKKQVLAHSIVLTQYKIPTSAFTPTFAINDCTIQCRIQNHKTTIRQRNKHKRKHK